MRVLEWDVPRPAAGRRPFLNSRTVADGGGDRGGGLRSDTFDAGDPPGSLG